MVYIIYNFLRAIKDILFRVANTQLNNKDLESNPKVLIFDPAKKTPPSERKRKRAQEWLKRPPQT